MSATDDALYVITGSGYVDLACLVTVTHNLDVHSQGSILAFKEKNLEWKEFLVEVNS